jgi:hypothetical protein
MVATAKQLSAVRVAGGCRAALHHRAVHSGGGAQASGVLVCHHVRGRLPGLGARRAKRVEGTNAAPCPAGPWPTGRRLASSSAWPRSGCPGTAQPRPEEAARRRRGICRSIAQAPQSRCGLLDDDHGRVDGTALPLGALHQSFAGSRRRVGVAAAAGERASTSAARCRFSGFVAITETGRPVSVSLVQARSAPK